MKLKFDKLHFHEPLQIVQAEVMMQIDGEEIIAEPLCIDVGLPAMLLSALQDTSPNRWAPPEEWEKMPFLVCGCGDPECRGFSFESVHEGETIILREVEETGPGKNRILEEYKLPLAEFRQAIYHVGKQFIDFMEGKNYKPLYPETIDTVKRLLIKIESAM